MSQKSVCRLLTYALWQCYQIFCEKNRQIVMKTAKFIITFRFGWFPTKLRGRQSNDEMERCFRRQNTILCQIVWGRNLSSWICWTFKSKANHVDFEKVVKVMILGNSWCNNVWWKGNHWWTYWRVSCHFRFYISQIHKRTLSLSSNPMSKAEKLKNKFLISNFKETRCLKITKTVSFELYKNTVYFWHEISYFLMRLFE